MRLLLVLALLLFSAPALAQDGWKAFADGGRTILIRHALAPGTGDPADFRIGDCATQRNLSAEGREQARRMGEAFRANNVPVEAVFTSQWCRCIDTAAAAFPEQPAEEFPAINSFFGDRSTEPEQTAEALAKILAFSRAGNQVFVTHQVNITALTGIVPAQGEALLVEPDGDRLRVVARMKVD